MSHKLNSSRIIDAFRASSLIAACILAPVTAHAQYHVSTPAYRVIPANPYNARGAWGEAVGQAYDFSQQRNNIQQWQQDQRNAWQYQEQYARQQLQQQEYLRAQQQQYQQQLRMNQQWNYANSTPRLAQPPAPMTYQQQIQGYQQLQQWNNGKQQILQQWNMAPIQRTCFNGQQYFAC